MNFFLCAQTLRLRISIRQGSDRVLLCESVVRPRRGERPMPSPSFLFIIARNCARTKLVSFPQVRLESVGGAEHIGSDPLALAPWYSVNARRPLRLAVRIMYIAFTIVWLVQ